MSGKYFAEVNTANGNVVNRVIVADSVEICQGICNDYMWVETYMENTPRRYCGKGWIYLSNAKAGGEFIEPQPYPSWTINGSIRWEAPVAYPNDGNIYVWDEGNTQWQIVN